MLHRGTDTSDAPKHVLCHGCHRYATCFRGPPLDPDAQSTAYRMRWIEGPFSWSLELPIIRDATVRAHKWWCVACVYRLVAAA